MSVNACKNRIAPVGTDIMPRVAGACEKIARYFRAAVLGVAICGGGPAVTGCAGLRADIKCVQEASSLEKSSQPVVIDGEVLPSVGEMFQVLEKALGAYTLVTLKTNHVNPPFINKTPNRLPEITDFEHIGINAGYVAEYLKKTMPVEWYQHIKSIGTKNDTSPDSYPGMTTKDTFAIFGTDTRKINITNSSLLSANQGVNKEEALFLFPAIDHEIAHGLDFESSPYLDTEQRVIMMYLIFRLISDPGRPKFEYPESIVVSSEEGDRSKAIYLKMKEFFAELARISLSDCEGENTGQWLKSCETLYKKKFNARALPAKWAVKLMKLHLQWSAPDFHPEKVTALRKEMATKALISHQIHRVKRVFASVPDKNLASLLTDALTVTKPFSRRDLGYQASILGTRALVEFIRDTDFVGGKPLQINPKKRNIEILMMYFNSLVYVIFNIRANQLGVRDENGMPLDFALGTLEQKNGDTTFREFIAKYNALSPSEKSEFLALAKMKLSVLGITAPKRVGAGEPGGGENKVGE